MACDGTTGTNGKLGMFIFGRCLEELVNYGRALFPKRRDEQNLHSRYWTGGCSRPTLSLTFWYSLMPSDLRAAEGGSMSGRSSRQRSRMQLRTTSGSMAFRVALVSGFLAIPTQTAMYTILHSFQCGTDGSNPYSSL